LLPFKKRLGKKTRLGSQDDVTKPNRSLWLIFSSSLIRLNALLHFLFTGSSFVAAHSSNFYEFESWVSFINHFCAQRFHDLPGLESVRLSQMLFRDLSPPLDRVGKKVVALDGESPSHFLDFLSTDDL
jgi:hypothetical protein